MVWLERDRRPQSTRRHGFTLIEITVTLAILAVATMAVVKWVAIQSRLNRQSETRLVAELTAQNAAERLRFTSIDDLPDAVEVLKADSSNQNLRFELTPFELDSRDAIHLRIDAVDSNQDARVIASEHLWRVSQPEGADDANE